MASSLGSVKTRKASVRRGSGALVLPLLAVVLVAAGFGCPIVRSYHRHKQLETCRLLGLMSGAVSRFLEQPEKSAVSPAELQLLVDRTNDGRDAWGRKVLVRTRQAGPGFQWLVISLGSDGKPDVIDLDSYFLLAPTKVQHIPMHDLVVRNGEFVTLAGK